MKVAQYSLAIALAISLLGIIGLSLAQVDVPAVLPSIATACVTGMLGLLVPTKTA